ncbi:MAG TPA: hypothetical protein VFA90_20465 [Terriglobales bacterium]|nr:hypothetical protein [Terriglobales bacterium]
MRRRSVSQAGFEDALPSGASAKLELNAETAGSLGDQGVSDNSCVANAVRVAGLDRILLLGLHHL